MFEVNPGEVYFVNSYSFAAMGSPIAYVHDENKEFIPYLVAETTDHENVDARVAIPEGAKYMSITSRRHNDASYLHVKKASLLSMSLMPDQIRQGIEDYLEENLVSGEPAEDDIPKVFIDGVIPTTKDDVLAEMTYISKTEEFHAYLKIKCQGNSSMAFPKKNFTIKMYSDEARETKLKKSFKDWNCKQNKYVLKANWIDHSHARNIVGARLWGEVVASRSDYASLPVELRNTPNNGAIDGFPIKVYTNGVYQGVYTWNVGKDDWMWGMDEDNPNHILLCAGVNTNEIHQKTPCNFRGLWSGIDGNHLEVEVGTNSDNVKNALNRLIECVMNSDNETFKANIENYLDLQSAIDYYIHQYVICGLDGLGKNMLLATYDLQKWILGAYDMDAVFGLWWDGNKFVQSDYRCPQDYQEAFSLLFERIVALYSHRLKTRYAELRKTVYSFSNMVKHFESITDVIGNDLFKEDTEVYTGIPLKDTNNIKQLRNFTRDRLEFCDKKFGGIDYTLNPLADVEWYDNQVYNLYSGELANQTGEHVSSKFKLQDCVYNYTADGCSYRALYIWDKNEKYLGCISATSAGANFGYFVARSDYLYAIKYYTTNADYNRNLVSLLPYDNSVQIEHAKHIPLELVDNCVAQSNYIEMDVTSYFESASDIHQHIQNANAVVVLGKRAHDTYPSDVPDQTWISMEDYVFASLVSDGTTVKLMTNKFGTSTEEATAFFAEKHTRLSFNNDFNAVQPDTPEYLYKLPQTKEFNGTSDYIDTGVKLFDTPKDFTIFTEIDSTDLQSETKNAVFISADSISNPNNGNLYWFSFAGEEYPIINVNNANGGTGIRFEHDVTSVWRHMWSNLKYVAFTFKNGVVSHGKYVKKDEPNTVYDLVLSEAGNPIYVSRNDSLIIGARKVPNSNTFTDHWKGTVVDFKIYSRALSEEELSNLMLQV